MADDILQELAQGHMQQTGRRRRSRATRLLLLLGATSATLAMTAGPSSAGGVTPHQLANAGWTCVVPLVGPSTLICAPPGQGLPPLPGTPGFAGRGPSYELLVFSYSTGELIGVQHLLRPDIYLNGTPPCPQQANGAYSYIPRNDTYGCFRAQ
jgi:hypothetical protein